MRGVVIDENKCIVKKIQYHWEITEAREYVVWQKYLSRLLMEIPLEFRLNIHAIAINGTSSTVLTCDAYGQPVQAPMMYNDACPVEILSELRKNVPFNHIVFNTTSSLAKLIWMSKLSYFSNAKYFLHQADWLGFILHRKLGITDYHNALKLGYDVENFQYPNWLEDYSIHINLPQVVAPGTSIAELCSEISMKYHFPASCIVCAGTTDSIAAFIASGAKFPGEAVTSLGSTLVLKLISTNKIEDSKYGIYSHRLGNLWLAGGASNTGGAVLKHFFSSGELENLSAQIDPSKLTNLDYYPLLAPGERFPINDPHLSPRMKPRPNNTAKFLHGMLEGIARIENRGYYLLKQLGADNLSLVYTTGGGSVNDTWRQIRKNFLRVPVIIPHNIEAAYGTALLAMKSIK